MPEVGYICIAQRALICGANHKRVSKIKDIDSSNYVLGGIIIDKLK